MGEACRGYDRLARIFQNIAKQGTRTINRCIYRMLVNKILGTVRGIGFALGCIGLLCPSVMLAGKICTGILC